MFASVASGLVRAHRRRLNSLGDVMSWKEGLLILMVLCAAMLACLARHFFRDVAYVADHLIAAAVFHAPGLLHFLARLVR